MVGEIEDGDLNSKLVEVEAMLDEYETKIGLGNLNNKEPDLSVTREQILAMHPEDIDGLRWEYASYALYLQKTVINKHTSRYIWADTNLKRFLERSCHQYEGWKWEERQANALADNIFAQKLDKLKLHSKMVIERTAFITNKIQFLIEIARDISYSKRKQARDEYGHNSN